MGPHRTRNTIVLRLPKTSSRVFIGASALTAHSSLPSVKCTTIANGRVFTKEEWNFKLMELLFWRKEEDRRPVLRIRVKIPKSWTPKMYLAAVHGSLERSHGQNPLLVYIVCNEWGRSFSVNGVHDLLLYRKEFVVDSLKSEGHIMLLLLK
jgi:hypothetical protein